MESLSFLCAKSVVNNPSSSRKKRQCNYSSCLESGSFQGFDNTVPDAVLQALIAFAGEKSNQALTDEFLKFAIRPELTVLRLEDCPKSVSGYFLSRELKDQDLAGLQVLHLTGAGGHLGPAELAAFLGRVGAAAGPGLAEVDLRGCAELNDEGVKQLVRKARGLRRLDLSQCPRLGWGFLEKLGSRTTLGGGVAQRLGRLRDLSLGCSPAAGTAAAATAAPLTDNALSAFLRELGGTPIAGSDHRHRRYQGLGELEALRAAGARVGTLTLQVLAARGRGLEVLDLSDTGLTDAGLGLVLRGCSNLHTLALLGDNALSLGGLRACYARLPRLAHLRFSINALEKTSRPRGPRPPGSLPPPPPPDRPNGNRDEEEEGPPDRPAAAAGTLPRAPPGVGPWACPRCTLRNTAHCCEACRQPRPDSDEDNDGGGGGGGGGEGSSTAGTGHGPDSHPVLPTAPLPEETRIKEGGADREAAVPAGAAAGEGACGAEEEEGAPGGEGGGGAGEGGGGPPLVLELDLATGALGAEELLPDAAARAALFQGLLPARTTALRLCSAHFFLGGGLPAALARCPRLRWLGPPAARFAEDEGGGGGVACKAVPLSLLDQLLAGVAPPPAAGAAAAGGGGGGSSGGGGGGGGVARRWRGLYAAAPMSRLLGEPLAGLPWAALTHLRLATRAERAFEPEGRREAQDRLALALPLLETLRLDECDAGTLDLTGCHSLHSLKLSLIPAYLRSIKTEGTLESFFISGDIGEQVILGTMQQNYRISDLKIFNIGYNYSTDAAPSMHNDPGLFSHLTNFHFKRCFRGYIPPFKDDLCKLWTSGRMVELGIHDSDITAAALKTVAVIFPNLRQLTISSCQSIDGIKDCSSSGSPPNQAQRNIVPHAAPTEQQLGSDLEWLTLESSEQLTEGNVLVESMTEDEIETYIRENLNRVSAGDINTISFPRVLTTTQRRLIHEISEQQNFGHQSVGHGENRFVRVWRAPPGGLSSASASDRDEEEVVEEEEEMEADTLFPGDGRGRRRRRRGGGGGGGWGAAAAAAAEEEEEGEAAALLQSTAAGLHAGGDAARLRPLLRLAAQLPRERGGGQGGRAYCLKFQRDCCPNEDADCDYAHVALSNAKLRQFKSLVDFSCRSQPKMAARKKKKAAAAAAESHYEEGAGGGGAVGDGEDQAATPSACPPPLLFSRLQRLAVSKCRSLEVISLEAPELVELECTNLKKLSICRAIVPKLVDLDLSECQALNCIPLSGSGSFKRMERAALNGCRTLRQPWVDALAARCPRLRRLELYQTAAAAAATNPSGKSTAKEKGGRIKTKSAGRIKSVNSGRPDLTIIYTKKQFNNNT